MPAAEDRRNEPLGVDTVGIVEGVGERCDVEEEGSEEPLEALFGGEGPRDALQRRAYEVETLGGERPCVAIFAWNKPYGGDGVGNEDVVWRVRVERPESNSIWSPITLCGPVLV